MAAFIKADPEGSHACPGSKRKLEYETAQCSSYLYAPDTKRRAPKRESFDNISAEYPGHRDTYRRSHSELGFKKEEDSDDEKPFVSRQRTPSLIPSTGAASSHSDLVVKREEDDDDESLFVSQPRTPSLIPSTGAASSHSDLVVKREEDVDDESLFVSQPRTPSLVPSRGTTTSPSSPTCPSSLRRSTSETIPLEPTPPTPWSNHAPKPSLCTCPIDLHCGVKVDHLIDCRPLVPEGEQWRPSTPGLNREDLRCNKEGETFATTEELANMVTLCNEIETEQPGTARGHIPRPVVSRLQALTALLNSNSVHPQDLESSQVLPRLKDFLRPSNEESLDRKKIPKSVREDMLMLVRRWEIGDLCGLAYRGLLRRQSRNEQQDENQNDSTNNTPTGSTHWLVDPNWPFRRPAAVFGHGGCVNGQTWPNRKAMLRDGAHGMWLGGIHGSKRRGAYAVVMGLHLPKGIKYADVDFGQTVYYIGTALKRAEGDTRPSNVMDDTDDEDEAELLDAAAAAAADGPGREPTDATQSLIKSRSTQLPVRLFRSSKASKLVPGRPNDGYRYDGLYRVVDYECLKAVRQIYRFKMIRLNDEEAREWGGQGPLRGWEPKTTTGKRGGRKR